MPARPGQARAATAPEPPALHAADGFARAAPVEAAPSPALRIGLLNNMPDAAFLQTERQFRRLLGSDVDLRLFAFRETRRGPAAQSHVDTHYAPHEALATAGIDALVITGSEPRCADLADEPYFAAMGTVVDWAATHTVSTLFSCLAAHAAVLHLDGIRRQRLPAKLSGIFACEAAGSHPLLAGLPHAVEVPHSRWNGLSEADLAERGYVVLQRSAAIGVDLFVREEQSLFVFLQGHPEYDPDSLAREFRRDMLRFLDGSSATCPSVPVNCFSDETAAHLGRIAAEAIVSRSLTPRTGIPRPELMTLRPPSWQQASTRLFRNWLSCVALRRSAGDRPGAARP